MIAGMWCMPDTLYAEEWARRHPPGEACRIAASEINRPAVENLTVLVPKRFGEYATALVLMWGTRLDNLMRRGAGETGRET